MSARITATTMDASLGYIIIFSLVGGLLSLIGAVLLLGSDKAAAVLAQYATPFAAGALLAAVFLDLLPEGTAEGDGRQVLLATLLGIVLFFMLERFLHWFHHHHEHQSALPQRRPKGLIILGDTLHNGLDGMAIAAAFLIDVPTGIVTAVAVAAHELPQEIGDFGLLLARGLSRGRVLLVNVMSALATLVTALATYWLGDADRLPTDWLLGVSAGFLLYIALSDLIPSIHQEASKKHLVEKQTGLLLLGIAAVALVIGLAGRFVSA